MKRVPFFFSMLGLNIVDRVLASLIEIGDPGLELVSLVIIMTIAIGALAVFIFNKRATDAGNPGIWKFYAGLYVVCLSLSFMQGVYGGMYAGTFIGEYYLSTAPPWVNFGLISASLVVGLTNLVYYFKPTAKHVPRPAVNDIHGTPVPDPAPWADNDDELFVTREEIEAVRAVVNPKGRPYDYNKGV